MAFNTDLSIAQSYKIKISGTDTTAGYVFDKIVAGANITITQNNVGGNETITITAGSGAAFTELPIVSGSVDGTNAIFEFSQKPTYLVSDGAWYKENEGWTWNSGTSEATLTIPPSSSLFGVV